MNVAMDSQLEVKPTLTPARLVSIVLLAGILLLIPVTVVILGQRTRAQIKADVECKQPAIPDPSECVNGQWQLYKNTDSCVRFRCVPR